MKIYTYIVLALAIIASLYLNRNRYGFEGAMMTVACVPGCIAAIMMPYWLGLALVRKIRKQPCEI